MEVLTQSLVRGDRSTNIILWVGGDRSTNIIVKGGTEVLTEQVFLYVKKNMGYTPNKQGGTEVVTGPYKLY